MKILVDTFILTVIHIANSGNNGDYGQLDEGPPSLKKKPSTNREMTAQSKIQRAICLELLKLNQNLEVFGDIKYIIQDIGYK